MFWSKAENQQLPKGHQVELSVENPNKVKPVLGKD